MVRHRIAYRPLEEAAAIIDQTEDPTNQNAVEFEDSPKPHAEAKVIAEVKSIYEKYGGDAPTIGMYLLEQIPAQVLCDLISVWETLPDVYGDKPYDFTGFEWAARAKGRGRHSWLIKFKNLDAIWVSYGFNHPVKLTPATKT